MKVRSPQPSHYYTKNGEPVYEVPYADPARGMRPTTLADARKMDLVPSSTTVAAIKAKPRITDWVINTYLDAVFDFGASTREEAIAIAEERMAVARDAGTEYHSALEYLCKNDGNLPDDLSENINRATLNLAYDFLVDNDIEVVETEWSFAHQAGYGGQIDLVGDQFGRTIILDWKTQDTAGKNIKYYDDWCTQLASYAEGWARWHSEYNITPVSLVSVVVSRDEELVEPRWWSNNDYDRCWHKFMALLGLWKLEKNYDGSFHV